MASEPKGPEQLRFEGLRVNETVNRMKGSVQTEGQHLKPRETVEFRGTAIVTEVSHRDVKSGGVDVFQRLQVLKVQEFQVVGSVDPKKVPDKPKTAKSKRMKTPAGAARVPVRRRKDSLSIVK